MLKKQFGTKGIWQNTNKRKTWKSDSDNRHYKNQTNRVCVCVYSMLCVWNYVKINELFDCSCAWKRKKLTNTSLHNFTPLFAFYTE